MPWSMLKTTNKSILSQLIKKISNDPTTIYSDLNEATIIIENIETVIHEGNTIYYIQSAGNIYEIAFDDSYKEYILFLDIGDELKVYYEDGAIKVVKQIVSRKENAQQ